MITKHAGKRALAKWRCLLFPSHAVGGGHEVQQQFLNLRRFLLKVLGSCKYVVADLSQVLLSSLKLRLKPWDLTGRRRLETLGLPRSQGPRTVV